MNLRHKILFVLILISSFAWLACVEAQEGLGPSEVSSIAFSPDGSRIAVASGPGLCLEDNLEPFPIRIFDAQSNQVIQSLVGHQCIVNNVAWSPDGSKLASSGEDGLASIWDVVSGEVISYAENSALGLQRRGVTWSLSGEMVADFIVTDPRVFIWNPETGGILAEIASPNGNRISAIAWSPDGYKLAIANAVSQLQIWDVSNTFSTGQVNLVSSFEDIPTITLAWSPDSNSLAYGTTSGLSILDIQTGRTLQTFFGHTQPVLDIAWGPNGDSLVSGSLDQTIRVWDVLTGLEIRRVQTTSRVRAVAWSPDGTKIAYGGAGGTIEIVPAPSVEPPTPALTLTPTNTPTPEPTTSETLLPTPTTILTPTSTPDPTLSPWGLVWSPDGQMLAVAYMDGMVRFYDQRGGYLHAFRASEGHLYSVTWSPNGALLATGGEEWAIRIWDVATGALVREIPVLMDGVSNVVWQPSGDILLVTTYDAFQAWNSVDWTPITDTLSVSILGMRWGPDGSRFAIAGTPQNVAVVQLRPDGKLDIVTLEGHTSYPYSVAWNAVGDRLVSAGGRDGSVRLWDVNAGVQLVVLLQTDQTVTEAVFVDEAGSRVVALTEQGMAYLLDGTTGDVLARQVFPAGLWRAAWNEEAQVLAISGRTADGTTGLRFLSLSPTPFAPLTASSP